MATRRAATRRSGGKARDSAARDDGHGRMSTDGATELAPAVLTWREWLGRPAFLGLNNGQALVLAGLLLVLLLTRFWDLGTRAMHHDESMHAKYAWDTYRWSPPYRYNPLLHGPFQFFAVAASFWLLGATEATARAVPAAFGVALVLLVFAWRRQLGHAGTALYRRDHHLLARLHVLCAVPAGGRLRGDVDHAARRGAGELHRHASARLALCSSRRGGIRLHHQGNHVHHTLHLRHVHSR